MALVESRALQVVPGALDTSEELPLEEEEVVVYGYIVVISKQGHDDSIFEIMETTTTFGRNKGCDVRIAKETVSGVHAKIDADEEGLWLTNLSNTNPTLLNGTKMQLNERILLRHMDCFTIADRKFRYEQEAEDAENSAPSSMEPSPAASRLTQSLAKPVTQSPAKNSAPSPLKERNPNIEPTAVPVQHIKNTESINFDIRRRSLNNATLLRRSLLNATQQRRRTLASAVPTPAKPTSKQTPKSATATPLKPALVAQKTPNRRKSVSFAASVRGGSPVAPAPATPNEACFAFVVDICANGPALPQSATIATPPCYVNVAETSEQKQPAETVSEPTSGQQAANISPVVDTASVDGDNESLVECSMDVSDYATPRSRRSSVHAGSVLALMHDIEKAPSSDYAEHAEATGDEQPEKEEGDDQSEPMDIDLPQSDFPKASTAAVDSPLPATVEANPSSSAIRQRPVPAFVDRKPIRRATLTSSAAEASSSPKRVPLRRRTVAPAIVYSADAPKHSSKTVQAAYAIEESPHEQEGDMAQPEGKPIDEAVVQPIEQAKHEENHEGNAPTCTHVEAIEPTAADATPQALSKEANEEAEESDHDEEDNTPAAPSLVIDQFAPLPAHYNSIGFASLNLGFAADSSVATASPPAAADTTSSPASEEPAAAENTTEQVQQEETKKASEEQENNEDEEQDPPAKTKLPAKRTARKAPAKRARATRKKKEQEEENKQAEERQSGKDKETSVEAENNANEAAQEVTAQPQEAHKDTTTAQCAAEAVSFASLRERFTEESTQLTVVQLRANLKKKGLPTAGLKADLVARWADLLAKEAYAVSAKSDDNSRCDETKALQTEKEIEDKKEKEENEDKTETAENAEEAPAEKKESGSKWSRVPLRRRGAAKDKQGDDEEASESPKEEQPAKEKTPVSDEAGEMEEEDEVPKSKRTAKTPLRRPTTAAAKRKAVEVTASAESDGEEEQEKPTEEPVRKKTAARPAKKARVVKEEESDRKSDGEGEQEQEEAAEEEAPKRNARTTRGRSKTPAPRRTANKRKAEEDQPEDDAPKKATKRRKMDFVESDEDSKEASSDEKEEITKRTSRRTTVARTTTTRGRSTTRAASKSTAEETKKPAKRAASRRR